MKIGIYIGSFNPPHKAHIYVVNYLLDNKVVDKILIIPTEAYWDKQNLASLKDRINMLKLYETENINIDTENNGLEYTYQLMRILKQKYKGKELFLIIGADNIINFDKWKNYEELLQYNIIVMNRNNIDIEKYTKKYPQGKFTIVKDFNQSTSSTEIRNNLNSKYLDKKVLKYIKKHNLYK